MCESGYLGALPSIGVCQVGSCNNGCVQGLLDFFKCSQYFWNRMGGPGGYKAVGLDFELVRSMKSIERA